MLELSKNELSNIEGGASIMITPMYAFIKLLRCVAKYIDSKF